LEEEQPERALSLAERAFSTLGLLGFSLNRYTSRLVNYCCQDYWFLQYDIYVSYPSGATWKELVQIAQFLVNNKPGALTVSKHR
jgi:hypothetical protein